MARRWYDPFTFSEWLKRTFSVLNIAVLVVTAMFVISEFRFDWFEKMVGSYLISTNDFRPQTGPIWETGRQTTNARQFLDTLISKKQKARVNVQNATSFTQLASGIQPGEWVTLEKQEFKSLYLTIHQASAARVVEPSYLLWLLNSETLDRIFCEGVEDGLNIYFIDSENRVIRKIELTQNEILTLEDGIQPVKGRLSDIPEFSGRIYAAEDFFNALFKLPSDIIPDLISHPEILLSLDGRITRVGIWNESENGYIRLGFEMQVNGDRRLIFLNGREWAVWQLSLNLKGEQE
jgi:hypothetical protein